MKRINLYLIVVVFVLHSGWVFGQTKKSVKSDPNVPLFEIKNDAGQTVFAVYPGGVHIFVDDTPLKGAGGGFTVGRLSTGKAGVGDILTVSPNNVNIIIDDGTAGKAAGGGFAVGRLSTGKAAGDAVNFLRVTPDSTRIYTSETSDKGFAVGKLNAKISGAEDFMRLNKSNYFIGHNSGNRATGLYNLFLGYESGFSNTTGESNTFIGYRAGYSNTDGITNVFIGKEAGYINSGSDYNTYIGYQAGYNATSNYNTAVGYQAGYSQTTWQAGTFLGFEAGKHTTGRQNVFLGSTAGRAFTTGGDNVCIGAGAGGSNDSPFIEATGTKNVFIGYYTGYKSAAASHNVILGHQDPFGETYITGSNNVYLGENAGNQSGAATGNVFIGYNAGLNETNSNRLYIDNSSTTTPLVFGDFSTNLLTFNGGVGINDAPSSSYALEINMDGNDTYALVAYGPTWCSSGAWAASDVRFKKNIETLNNSLEKVIKLRGVSFEYKTDENGSNGFTKGKTVGLIAQETEKIIPEVVAVGPDGYKAIAYDKLAAVLIEAVKEQQKEIEKQTVEMSKLKEENSLLKQKLVKVDKLENELEELKKITEKLLKSSLDKD